MASTSSEAPPSSHSETPTINNSTKTNSKFSIQSLVANLKAKFRVSKPKPDEHSRPASSSEITSEDDNHGGAVSLSSETIQKDLLLLNSAMLKDMHRIYEEINEAHEKFKKQLELSSTEKDYGEVQNVITRLKGQIPSHPSSNSKSQQTKRPDVNGAKKVDNHGGAISDSSRIDSSEIVHKDLLLLDSALMKYMHHTNEKINKARGEFEDPQKSQSSEREVRTAITKLKGQIPSHRSSESKSQPREWPDINGVGEEKMHFFYKEPEAKHTVDLEGRRKEDLSKAFKTLPRSSQCCLLCFFKFPSEADIKRTTLIYLWIAQGHIPQPDAGKMIFDELITKEFIERCPLEPNSYMMSPSVRSSLDEAAQAHGNVCGCQAGEKSCLINIGETIINNEPKIPQIFESGKDHIQSLHLGRWQSSGKYHIELENIKILDGLKNLKKLKFLSLRGISMITELPPSILELDCLEILDVRACHNLERIPDNIDSLKSLTHLDMSECYFLDHMPKSLAQLSKLEVLKGFFIGHAKKKKQPCTLQDLSSKLEKLRKLNIYTSVKEFPIESDLKYLENLKGLRKLTISWGGCSSKDDSMATDPRPEGPQPLHLPLQKLDLQGFQKKSLPQWLRPANLKELKKLYIRGGNLCDLGQVQERTGEKWKVEVLRLKYLSALKIDGNELRSLFPELIYLHQLIHPNLTSFPDATSGVPGVWIDDEAIDNRFWLQKFFQTNGITLSSLVGYHTVKEKELKSVQSASTSAGG